MTITAIASLTQSHMKAIESHIMMSILAMITNNMTKSYNYNEATRDIERSKEVTRHDVVSMIMNATNGYEQGTIAYNDKETAINQTIGNKHGLYLKEAIVAYDNIKATGAYPYLDTVAIELLRILDIPDTHNTRSRAKHVCYYTNRYMEALQVVEKYQAMFNDGYIHISDITEDMHGKKALLTGKNDIDWFTTNKDNEKVTIVCTGSSMGYKKPKQRTKYYPVMIYSDYFIKLTE